MKKEMDATLEATFKLRPQLFADITGIEPVTVADRKAHGKPVIANNDTTFRSDAMAKPGRWAD